MNKVKCIFVNNIHIFCAKRLLKNKKALTARNCEGSFFYSGININMNVMPIMEFTLLGLSFEVHLRIALKQRKIADFEIVVNYFFSPIAA